MGATAFFAPHAFYADFPFFASWVDKAPPYNQHLVTDVGGLYLGFAILLAWSLRRRELVVPVCAAFALVQVLHTGYHLFHLRHFGALDGAAEIVALASLIAAPLLAIVFSSPGRWGG